MTQITVQASRISSFEARHSRLLAALPSSIQNAYTIRKQKASTVPGLHQALLHNLFESASHCILEDPASSKLAHTLRAASAEYKNATDCISLCRFREVGLSTASPG